MIYNILNGDGLAYSFAESNIAGEIIVCREAFIDGELAGGDLPTFWQSRATFLSIPNAEYQEKVVKEFDKIINATDGAEFNLWFEYDLFCQVNMWFVLSMIQSLSIKKTVNAVYTAHLAETDKQFWNGFGLANSEELNICKSNRITLNEADLNLGTALWSAYKGVILKN